LIKQMADFGISILFQYFTQFCQFNTFSRSLKPISQINIVFLYFQYRVGTMSSIATDGTILDAILTTNLSVSGLNDWPFNTFAARIRINHTCKSA